MSAEAQEVHYEDEEYTPIVGEAGLLVLCDARNQYMCIEARGYQIRVSGCSFPMKKKIYRVSGMDFQQEPVWRDVTRGENRKFLHYVQWTYIKPSQPVTENANKSVFGFNRNNFTAKKGEDGVSLKFGVKSTASVLPTCPYIGEPTDINMASLSVFFDSVRFDKMMPYFYGGIFIGNCMLSGASERVTATTKERNKSKAQKFSLLIWNDVVLAKASFFVNDIIDETDYDPKRLERDPELKSKAVARRNTLLRMKEILPLRNPNRQQGYLSQAERMNIKKTSGWKEIYSKTREWLYDPSNPVKACVFYYRAPSNPESLDEGAFQDDSVIISGGLDSMVILDEPFVTRGDLSKEQFYQLYEDPKPVFPPSTTADLKYYQKMLNTDSEFGGRPDLRWQSFYFDYMPEARATQVINSRDYNDAQGNYAYTKHTLQIKCDDNSLVIRNANNPEEESQPFLVKLSRNAMDIDDEFGDNKKNNASFKYIQRWNDRWFRDDDEESTNIDNPSAKKSEEEEGDESRQVE